MMGFMQPQIQKDDWYQVETSDGTEWLPADLVGENPAIEDFWVYCEGRVESFELRRGLFGARFSAPGYLDCTPWVCFEKREDAEAYLREENDDYEEADEFEGAVE